MDDARLRGALLCGALALFALLYAPQPLLPRLAEEHGLAPGTAALVISAATFGLAVAAIPLGTVAQAVGRRRIMIGAVLLAEALALVLPWLPSFPLLVGVRLVQGVAVAGVAALATAHLAEESGGRGIGTAMGLYVAGSALGGMTGRIVGGVVGDLAGWRGGLLAVAGLSAAFTALFVALLPPERHHRRQPLRWRPLLGGLGAALRDPELRGPYAIALLGTGAFATVFTALPFRLTAPPFLVPPALAALAFLAYTAGTATSALAGRVADRWGRLPVLLGGLVLCGAGLGLMLGDVLALVLGGLVVFTGGFFAAHAVAGAWVGARAPEAARGQAGAVYQFTYYVGTSLGGVLGGAAYGTWGWTATTALLTGFLLLAALAALRSSPGRRAGARSVPAGGAAAGRTAG
ncbi:MFS transporter [Saccharopolyspora cebuensis]|uniref:MFS transporter n=1 Tax=Saccharopolyspora cebuensis TaxID=418759 RepID=A0ABV4CPB3_9PSEU